MAPRYRRRRPSTGTRGALSIVFTPTVDPIAQAAKQWNDSMRRAQDQGALEKLADGHSEWFIDFAEARVKETGASEDDRTYWTGLLNKAKRRLADDTIAEQVGTGEKSLEDLMTHLQARATEVGPTHGEYPELIKQMGAVKASIASRNFNNEVLAVHKKLIDTGDREVALRAYQALLVRSTDDETTKALAGQVKQLEGEVQKAKQTQRAAEVNTKLTAYYTPDGGVSRAEVLSLLTRMAGTALTVEEANHYTALAAQIDTRERTLERQRVSEAAASGTRALAQGLAGPKDSYEWADAAVVSATRGATRDRAPLEDAFTQFEKEATHYRETLIEALPFTRTASDREKIADAIRAVDKNIALRGSQTSSAVAKGIVLEVQSWESAIKGIDDPDLLAQYRYLAIDSLRKGLADPLIQKYGNEVEGALPALEKKLADVSAAHRKDISDLAKTVNSKDKGQKAIGTAYQQYEDFMRSDAAETGARIAQKEAELQAALAAKPQDKKLVEKLRKDIEALRSGGNATAAADIGAFLDAIDSGDGSALGLNALDPEAAGKFATWTSNVLQATREEQKAADEARTRLRVLVAPRTLTGKRATDYSQGPLDVTEALRAGPELAGAINTLITDQPRMEDLPPNEWATYGYTPPPSPEVPEEEPANAGGRPGLNALMPDDDDENADPYARAENRALAFLDTTSDIELPNYEIPDLPEMSFLTPTISEFEYLGQGVSQAPITVPKATDDGMVSAAPIYVREPQAALSADALRSKQRVGGEVLEA